LEKCSSFADIGCDHGFFTEYMLKNNMCERAYISDISKECLSKAELLLKDYIAQGRVVSRVADGLKGADKNTSLTLIAGMGGMEIIKILSEGFLPLKFVLQPMKDSPRLRKFLVDSGAKITLDVTFADGGYFYDVIKGERSGGSRYSEDELAFGKTNLVEPTSDFIKKIDGLINKNEGYLSLAQRQDTAKPLIEKINLLKRIKKECSLQIKR